ncbi:MAG: hypothetical protein Q7S11_00530 [bacterium]|nr:hypothetical protein [bacterium]
MDKEIILSAVQDACSVSTSLITCESCGRVHFNDEEPEKLEELTKKAQVKPDRYIDHGDVSIAWFTFNGKQVVVDCQCDKAAAIGKFLWQHRFFIRDVLVGVAEKNAEIARGDQKSMGKLQATPL